MATHDRRSRIVVDPDDSAERKPPRYAAALRYEGGMGAPIVVAKGRGLVAEEIVRRAAEHGIAIHVSDNLAAMLMQVDLDRAIPPQLFHAVAQLLAWLYLLEGRAGPRDQAPSPAAS
jgi:flagellar biosynthesis protein